MGNIYDYNPHSLHIYGGGGGQMVEVLGAVLSQTIHCRLKLAQNPIYHDHFVCRHDVLFPLKRLQEGPNWAWAIEEHERRIKQDVILRLA